MLTINREVSGGQHGFAAKLHVLRWKIFSQYVQCFSHVHWQFNPAETYLAGEVFLRWYNLFVCHDFRFDHHWRRQNLLLGVSDRQKHDGGRSIEPRIVSTTKYTKDTK
ncbi:hypothetical protein [Allorhodopirellula heiligendammensis]|uniref:Uncharacterized protein n=1 Tax=Allorhodopirellula heiligendammensis TaxID=2714739 RepID=A0A5C6C595_9BACT|nr:hypothetical protein [Allorhodopirellula heiligendammensis]TWU18494.1 hypothetical protein Poly21_06570 [Allorhodopirellula heiligendammensis]